MTRAEIILGYTEDGSIVVGELENRNYFSVCFSTYYARGLNEEDVQTYFEDLMDDMDAEWKIDQLEVYDCRPSELAEKMSRDSNIEDTFDTSSYGEFDIEGIDRDVYLMCSSGGQHDTRGEMDFYLNKELYDNIHELWDKFHLKEMDDQTYEDLMNKIEKHNQKYDIRDTVEKWLIDDKIYITMHE